MTWLPSTRTPAALAVYAAAEQDRRERPQRYRFDAAAIVARAVERSGMSEQWFAPGWQSGLAEFVESAQEEARLNAVGIRMALQSAISRLVAGAQISHCHHYHSDVVAVALPPPIVIIGGWRTGTTFLFRLLGLDPRLHAQLPAELAAPWLFADGGGDPDISSAATDLLHTLNPDMAHVHPSGPRLPEECVLGMGTDLRNWGFTSMMRLPSYARWLAVQDFEKPYQRYRDALQILASGDSRRFVLKAPAHTAELDHLVDAFPGAVIVSIRRDIVETLASGASLFAVYRTTYSDAVDPIEVGRHQVDQSELWFRRCSDYRSSTRSAAATFVDLDYRQLVTDTGACLTRIYAAADMEPPGAVDDFVAAYHADRPHTPDRHRYSAEDFGIDPGEVRERFSFLDVG